MVPKGNDMSNLLLRFHRFLVSQSFYPIVLSSMLAVSIYIGRVLYSGIRHSHSYLIWNLILAWIPYAFSMLALFMQRRYQRWWALILPGAVWMAFLPNAPYIVTDFLHLDAHPEVPIWYDILMLATFSWTGVFLAIVSLHAMQSLVRAYLGSLVSWLFVAASLGLCGLGIYLGRFERWNSWDLLIHPKTILKYLALRFTNPLDNLGFFGFTVLFTAFLLVCYLMFTSRSTPEGA